MHRRISTETAATEHIIPSAPASFGLTDLPQANRQTNKQKTHKLTAKKPGGPGGIGPPGIPSLGGIWLSGLGAAGF